MEIKSVKKALRILNTLSDGENKPVTLSELSLLNVRVCRSAVQKRRMCGGAWSCGLFGCKRRLCGNGGEGEKNKKTACFGMF